MTPAELDVFDLDGTDIGDGALLAGEIMPEPSDYLSRRCSGMVNPLGWHRGDPGE